MLTVVSLSSPTVTCLPRPGIVPATTVSAAFLFKAAPTAFRYVTPTGPTHDNEPILNGPRSPTNVTSLQDRTTRIDVVLSSLNSEPGCIKVVDTFRCSPASRGRVAGRCGRRSSCSKVEAVNRTLARWLLGAARAEWGPRYDPSGATQLATEPQPEPD